MPENMIIAGIALGGVLMDLHFEKVKNEWILFGLFQGILFQCCRAGISGLLFFSMGALVPVLSLFPLFYFRMLGAGDIKLLSALGGVMGVESIWRCIFYSFLTGGCISILILFTCGNLRERFTYFFQYFSDYKNTGRRVPYRRKSGWENFHFTVPVFLAVLLYIGGFY